MTRRNIFILSFIAGVFLLPHACNNSSNSTTTSEEYEVPEEVLQIPFGTTYGLRAPEIRMPDLNGEIRSLSDLHGKVVLLDFWASWCNPCRQENPHLVKVYNAYKDAIFTEGKGFEIFSVSLDRNDEAWREAVKTDQLPWPYQLGDMDGARTKAALDYGIQMIPTNYLLDRNGVIIATNLRGEALEEKLQSLAK